MCSGPAAGVARCIGRRPFLVFGITMIVTILISVLALVVGEFSIETDNDGWNSRGTKLANRQVQYERLMGDDSDGGASNCNPTIQPECWASGRAPASRRSLSAGGRRAARRLSGVGMGWAALKAGAGRRGNSRQLNGSDSGPSNGHVNEEQNDWEHQCHAENWDSARDLAVVYRARDGQNLLSAAVFQQVCELEEQVLALGNYVGSCRRPDGGACDTVHGGSCLAPKGGVSELRKATPGGWSMSCAELVSDATILEQLTDELARCIASDDCESAGYVGFDFTNTSRSTATMYATFPLQQGGALNFISDSSGDLGGMSSAGVRLAYGQKNSEEYEDEVMDEILANDMILVQGSMAVSLFFLLLNTRSLFMSLVGLLQVGFSFPVAYFFYKLVFGFSFFPFLNFLGLFVIMGIGVDDLFVVTDKWAQAARRLGDGASEVNIAAEVGPDAAFTMLLTSITTAAAFFATSVVPVAPIRLFALFMGFMVLADYLLCLVMSFPACVLQHRWVSYARKTGNKCVLGVLDFSSCCTGPPSGRPKV